MKKETLFLPGQTIEEHLSQLAEEILNESMVQFRKKQLRMEIDRALEQRDKEKFIQLTEELNNL